MADDKLTAAQKLAVERPGGPILVSAAAGSGKTKVIVERLMERILNRDEPCNLNEFLIITFTTKAAAELRTRIARELTERLALDPENTHLQRQQSRLYLTQISTIHSFCANLLREFAYELNIPADFRMLEETEAMAIREELADELLSERYEALAEDPELQSLVDGLGAGRDDNHVQGLLLDAYKTAQCRLFPDKWLRDCGRMLELAPELSAEDTVWGQELIRGFRQMLEDQKPILACALRIIEDTPALVKYQPTFEENLALLDRLQSLRTWDEIRAAAGEPKLFGKLGSITNCEDPDRQKTVKRIRDSVTDRIKAWFEVFYGDSAQVLSDLRLTSSALRGLFSLIEAFTERYAAEKHRLHALDFNDLEHEAVRLLLEPDGLTPTPTAKLVSQHFREILVDEYQDTNQVQDSLFRAVSREGKNRFMVGDVKQSIYRFRLADPTIFIRKYNAYPDAAEVGPEDRQRILLSQNFRSGEAILDAVNAVFSRCMSPRVGDLTYGPAEALLPGQPKQPLPQTQVELHCLSTKADGSDEEAETPEKTKAEARYVARRVRRLLAEKTPVRTQNGTRPVEPGDIVILLRSPRNAAGYYLDALRDQGIPAASDSGESILETSEVESLLNLLKVLDNVHRDIPLAGALLSPLFGVSGTELALARAGKLKLDLYDALTQAPEASANLKRALETIGALRELSRELPLHSLMERIRQKTDLESVYGAMENGAPRLRNLRVFDELAAGFAEGGKKSLHQFLYYVETLKQQGGVSGEAAKTNAVTVMSIHKSKGLEFPVVILSDLSKNFNTDDLKQKVQFHSRLGAGCSVYDAASNCMFPSIARTAISRQTKAENLSEELRVLYVAMTRPRDMLIMTYCSASTDTKLRNLAERLTPETVPALSAQAGCLGDWVLLAALLRTEAGALHAVGGRPEETFVSEIPWRIEYHDLQAEQTEQPAVRETESAVTEGPDPVKATEYLRYVYPHPGAVDTPSKLTATQLKGRNLDEEADDGVQTLRRRARLREPALLREDRSLTPAERGTAVHQAMQYLDFSRTASLEQIREQLDRMVEACFLTEKQAKAVSPEKLFRVFEGELGSLIRQAEQVFREVKFSILTPAEPYAPAAQGEQLMLQGVTDCFLIKDGAITVIDFKTDRIKPGEEGERAKQYRPQLEAYGLALERIYGLPVTRKLLYFFATDALEEI